MTNAAEDLSEVAELRRQIEVLEDETRKRKSADREREKQQAVHEVAEHRAQAQAAQKQVADLTTALEDARDQITDLEERISSSARVSELEQDIEELVEAAEAVQQDLALSEKKREGLVALCSSQLAQLKEAVQHLEPKLKSSVESVQAQCRELEVHLSDLMQG
jgi:chromosome segregation ATPase